MPDPFTIAAVGAGLAGVGLSVFGGKSDAAKPPGLPKPPRCEPADTWYEQALARGAAILGLPASSPAARSVWDQMDCGEKNFFITNPTVNWQVILACRAVGQKAPCLPPAVQKLFSQASDAISSMGASIAAFGQGSPSISTQSVGDAISNAGQQAKNTAQNATSVGGRGCFGLC